MWMMCYILWQYQHFFLNDYKLFICYFLFLLKNISFLSSRYLLHRGQPLIFELEIYSPLFCGKYSGHVFLKLRGRPKIVEKSALNIHYNAMRFQRALVPRIFNMATIPLCQLRICMLHEATLWRHIQIHAICRQQTSLIITLRLIH